MGNIELVIDGAAVEFEFCDDRGNHYPNKGGDAQCEGCGHALSETGINYTPGNPFARCDGCGQPYRKYAP